MPVFGSGYAPPVPTQALWLWDTSGAIPVVSGYPQLPGVFTQTKTGLTPQDLQNFVGVPLNYYGNPPIPVASGTILQWLRWAEDTVEQETSILLCQTWVASPPTLTPSITAAVGLDVNTPSAFQQQGYDYDLEDSAYDFMFSRAQDEGWMMQTLRYRPVQSLAYGVTSGAAQNNATAGITAVKNIAYIYPLLNVFFRVPPGWYVEDKDFGLIRLVPAQNVQMLPLFAMQLAFMGFAENVPGALWYQYTAGLTPFDYQSRFAFMQQLVLCEAAIMALSAVQGTINLGAEGVQTLVDGLGQQFKYPASGPFSGLIGQFTKMKTKLLQMAKSKVEGPVFNTL